MKKPGTVLIILLFAISCKTIDDDWLTPQWIMDKIEVLKTDCYYKNTTINRYALDNVMYVEVYVPNHLWPEENVFYEDGRQVIAEDTSFSYYYFSKNKGTIIEKYWEYPKNSGCP